MRAIFSSRIIALMASGLSAMSSVRGAEIGQDFRGKPYDANLFLPTGPGFAAALQFDRDGLRIVLPPEHARKPPVGIVFRTGVKGDFEITMAFEVVDVPEPKEGAGAGPTLYLTMVSPTRKAATTGRKLRPDGSTVFFAHHASTPPGGRREHAVKTTPAKERSGKLRFVRTGPTLTYLAADGKSGAFREIDRFELGEDDVDMVRVAADNGGSPTLVDVRINSVKIVADSLGEPTSLPPPSSRWPLWLAAGLVLLAAGGAYWFWRRR